MEIEADYEIDASGLRCPEPLMVVRNMMMDMASGEILKMVATDPSTSWDYVKYCKFLNHELLHQVQTGSVYVYWIKKG